MFPFVSLQGQEKIDVTLLVEDVRNVLLIDSESEAGGFLFFHKEPGIYELHANFLKHARGYRVIRIGMEAVRWMFLNTDCIAIQAKIPAFNKRALKIVAACGAVLEADREHAWAAKDGSRADISFFALRFNDWVRNEKSCAKGEELIGLINPRLSEGVARLPDEMCFLRRLNIFAEMVEGGQPEKAAVMFNQWSNFVGFGFLMLIAKSPVTFDLGSVLLQYIDNKFMAVAKCQLAH